MEIYHLNAQKSVGEIVAEDYYTAEVFLKYGIDFCCGGKKTLAEVCEVNQLDIDLIIKELQEVHHSILGSRENFNEWDLAFLSDYILHKHHRYVFRNLPIINHLLEKVTEAHHEKHPELKEIKEIFIELSEELQSHLQKEEKILFPYIKNLAGSERFNLENPKVCVKTIDNPVKMMEAEHEEAGILMKLLRNLTQNYHLPEDACQTYKIAFAKLQEFEKDLFQHVHLENNILFPKALKAEKRLLETS